MRLWFVLLTALSVWTVSLSADSPSQLFTVVSTADEETQMMAMVLSTQAARQGAEVRVLLCGEAGFLATEVRDSKRFAPPDRSPRDLMRALISQGVTVEICAIFLPNRDLDEDALIEGVTVARPPEVTQFMLAPNTRVLSF